MATTFRPLRAQSLQNRRHLIRQHGDVASDLSICICAEEGRPSVQAHAGVDCRTHFFQVDIIAADRDFVDLAVLLALMADQFGDFGCIDWSRQ